MVFSLPTVEENQLLHFFSHSKFGCRLLSNFPPEWKWNRYKSITANALDAFQRFKTVAEVFFPLGFEQKCRVKFALHGINLKLMVSEKRDVLMSFASVDIGN